VDRVQGVMIGVDPQELSATIEVVDCQDRLLGTCGFTADNPRIPRCDALSGPGRTGSGRSRGANGAGRPLAHQRVQTVNRPQCLRSELIR
jgi:transposase